MARKKLVVIGMGYVGIPAAALFADSGGFEVVGIQRRSERSGWKIDFLNAGKSPFPETEPGIAELIGRVVNQKKTFHVTDDFEEINDADFILIDVQTPVEASDHNPRYESLREVCKRVAGLMKRGVFACIESTVAPGTTVNVAKPLLEEISGLKAGDDFHLCFSYERVMVGRLLHNIRKYPRVVGGFTARCAEIGVELYSHVVQAEVVPTDCLTAEIAKTTENAYRDVNIAFANEIALMCESLGANVYEVRKLVNNLPNDPSNPLSNPVRNMHFPGAGVGGHCLPKDSWLLKYGVDTYGKFPVHSKVLVGSREINDEMPLHMCELAVAALKQKHIAIETAKVAVLGYAFLENSDDTRNTPAVPLIDALKRRGIKRIEAHDPYVRQEEVPEIKRDLAAVLDEADCVCLVTKHDEYMNITPELLVKKMKTPIFIDGRNLFSDDVSSNEFLVRSIGKGTD